MIFIQFWMVCLMVLPTPWLSAQTKAHRKSAFAVIDPAYSSDKKVPSSTRSNGGAVWIYGPGELECWRLQLLRARKDSARLMVGYPGVFHEPYCEASFRMKPHGRKKAHSVSFRCTGRGELFLNSKPVFRFPATDTEHSFILPRNEAAGELHVDVFCQSGIPGLQIKDGPYTTTGGAWQWKGGNEEWQRAYPFPQTKSGVPPHQDETPEMLLHPVRKQDNLYDFGRETFGYLVVKSEQKPVLTVGESMDEAFHDGPQPSEQSTDMMEIENGTWKSKTLVAFRYVHTKTGVDSVSCHAVFHPVSYRGAFACSDSLLTRIWMNSAYTLRLCMHDFLIDGIKRDRLPWIGDMAMSMMANAYTFRDPEIVRRSLIALGRAGIREADLNGIIDYSLWWVISQDHFQLYFGNRDHLKREWPRIRETLDLLAGRCDQNGFLDPGKSWLFIDWVDQEKWTALQVLWWWAQESGARLARRMDDAESETYWTDKSRMLKKELEKAAWSGKDGIWLGNPQLPDRISRHANFLAVVSGLTPAMHSSGIYNLLKNNDINRVGTPYMAGFEKMAFARLGDAGLMLDQIKTYWGGMIEKGATSFWEAYEPEEKGRDCYAYYDRPYGKSLCHAWSAGPAAVLPFGIFGLRPVEDGWKRFSVNPDPGYLKWASTAVPTSFGDIVVDIDEKNMVVSVPKGTIAGIYGKSYPGPVTIRIEIIGRSGM